LKNICICGQLTEEGTTLCPRCEALHILGLGMEGLEYDIRSAYRLLVKVWHPDHFQDDPKLKEAAETKLKDIHAAFDYLTMTSTDRGHAQRLSLHQIGPCTAAERGARYAGLLGQKSADCVCPDSRCGSSSGNLAKDQGAPSEGHAGP
jgi:hypothetical protein